MLGIFRKMSLYAIVVLLLGAVLQAYSGDAFNVNLYALLQAPGPATGLLGTDELGRDVLARLLIGAKISLVVGVSVVVVAGTFGTFIGLLSGYFGGMVDHIIMRITDIFLAFPGILLAIAFAALMGPGVENVIFALCIMGWVGFARLARAQALSLRHMAYVEASQISGMGLGHILWKHILPNAAAPLIVEAVFAMAGAMIAEAGLSFLGLGVQPPNPSLGAMLREGARYMPVAPHLVLAPGLLLMALVLGLNIIGDNLRDKLDARL